jgi:hypothetical protein
MCAFAEAHRERWSITTSGLTTHQDRVDLSAQLMHMGARSLTGDPLRVTTRGRETAIKGHRAFKAHPRSAGEDPFKEGIMQSSAGLTAHTDADRDAHVHEPRDTSTAH